MLCKFMVSGYKGFNKKICFDFEDHNDYQFNKNLIQDDLINKSIVYGKNGSGKTNLGFALFDLVFHLTDKHRNMSSKIEKNYLNMSSNKNYAEFYYEFKFGDDIVIYEYKKESLYKLLYEKVLYNGKKIIEYDFLKPENKFIDLKDADNLNWKYYDSNELSVLRYICNNTILKEHKALNELMEFVNGMLWFRSVDSFGFIGLMNRGESLDTAIIDNGKLDDFSKFLKNNGLNFKLVKIDNFDKYSIGIEENNKVAPFGDMASSGTSALWLYYYWEMHFKDVKFLFIDEFDATYHFDLAANIVKRINDNSSFQSVLTTHNTYLMNNKLTRPDCTFILTPKFIKNLSSCTEKELREAHNIEKLYREGLFTD